MGVHGTACVLLVLAAFLAPADAQAMVTLTISMMQQAVTEKELNQGTAFGGLAGGVVITATGANFKSLTVAERQTIVNNMASTTMPVDPNGFNAKKNLLVQPTDISTSGSLMYIKFTGVREYDIAAAESIQITLAASDFATSAMIATQADPIVVSPSAAEIVLAKRPYDDATGNPTSHTMDESDARVNNPSFYIAVSPWESFRDDTPADGKNDMARTCAVSDKTAMTHPNGWAARVAVPALVVTMTSLHKDANGDLRTLTLIPGLEGWRFLEVFITADVDYDTHDTETISIDAACAKDFLNSDLAPTAQAKISFTIVPTPGVYYVSTTPGTLYETDFSVGAACAWTGISTTQLATPTPTCDYATAVRNPANAAGHVKISVILEKGETWLQDATAKTSLVNSFTSTAGGDFANHKTDFLLEANIAYPDAWTAEITVNLWPQWTDARRAVATFDANMDEYVEVILGYRAVKSNSASLPPEQTPPGTMGKPSGFTILAAPGWLQVTGNIPACNALSQANCAGPACQWEAEWAKCRSTQAGEVDLTFTEEDIRLGRAMISIRFASPPGYDSAGTAIMPPETLYQPIEAAPTDTFCVVVSSSNQCTKSVDVNDVRSIFYGASTDPTYFEARQAGLVTSGGTIITQSEILITLQPDADYDIWTDDVLKVYIPHFEGDDMNVGATTRMTASGLVPVAPPAPYNPFEVTIQPARGQLTVQHATLTHDPSFIILTEEQVRAGAGSLRMTWQGESWVTTCCKFTDRGGGGAGGATPAGGLRLESSGAVGDIPNGWNAFIQAEVLLPDAQLAFEDGPTGADYARTLVLNFQEAPLFDTDRVEYVTVSIFDTAVKSTFSYENFGWPQMGCTTMTGCSDFVIIVEPTSGNLTCVDGPAVGQCPELTEEDIRTGGKTITLMFAVGETWADAGATFEADLLAAMNSDKTPSQETNGWQARKGTIIPAGSISVTDVEKRTLVITLTADPMYDLVNTDELVSIQILPSSTKSNPAPIPAFLTFNIKRAPSTVSLSACRGLKMDLTTADPAPVTVPTTDATADCATTMTAQTMTGVTWPGMTSTVDAIAISERDLRLGDVSLRIKLECGETWQSAANLSPEVPEALIKSALSGIPGIDNLLPDGQIFTKIDIPTASACPQTVSVQLTAFANYDISEIQYVTIDVPDRSYSSGLDHPPMYLLILPYTGTARLNVVAGELTDPNSGSVVKKLDEDLIRSSEVVGLMLTLNPGETWAQTTACKTALLATFNGQATSNNDPNAWGPGQDDIHQAILSSSAVVEFRTPQQTAVRLQQAAAYEISTTQKILVDIPAVCAASGLQPWWETTYLEAADPSTVSTAFTKSLLTDYAGGRLYTEGLRNAGYAGGQPGVGFFEILPSAGYLRLEMSDGRGCDGWCEAGVVPIVVTDREIRAGTVPTLHLLLQSEMWLAKNDAQAGAVCPATGTPPCIPALTPPLDLCASSAMACSCTAAPAAACCAINPNCAGTMGANPVDFNLKSAVWYYTHVFGEDWPKSPVSLGGTLADPGSAVIASANNPSGFTARKENVFPAPLLTPDATSVTWSSATQIDIKFIADADFEVTANEKIVIQIPNSLTLSGLAPITDPTMMPANELIPGSVELTVEVTPIIITLAPKAEFTEQEIREGVTLTLMIDTGCWATDASQRVLSGITTSKTAMDEPNGFEAKRMDTAFVDASMPSTAACPRRMLEIEIKSSDFGVVPLADSYDITATEVLTFAFTKEMVGSTVAPIGMPDPITVTITPIAGLVTLTPALVSEYQIRTCSTPIELTVSLLGESFTEPYTTQMRQCIRDAFDSINADSEFDRLNRATSLTPIIEPGNIVFNTKWEAKVYIECRSEYNTLDPEIVLMRLGRTCIKSGIQPVAQTGSTPPRFQIEIEGAAEIELLTTTLTEEAVRTQMNCVMLQLTAVTTADGFVDDSTRIYAEMASDRAGTGWEFGFTARKATLLQPASITVTGASQTMLSICFAMDPMYRIDSEEVITILVHGTGVRSGITPNYKNNVPLQLRIQPSPGRITLSPTMFDEDHIRDGSAVLTMTLAYGESWAFNPASCIVGAAGASCSGRAMCDCVNNALCTPAMMNTSVTQPYGFNERFAMILTTPGVAVLGTQALTVKFTADHLFDVTEQTNVRVEVPGCGTASGLATMQAYFMIRRTPGKIMLVHQMPQVGSLEPCGLAICNHTAPLMFTERDVRAGNMEFALMIHGDLWLNKPVDIQAAAVSDCPAVVGAPTDPYCPVGWDAKRSTIMPTTGIKINDTDMRVLVVNLTAEATYNIDRDERVCLSLTGAVTASGVAPEMLMGGTQFCFRIKVVAGHVRLETMPADKVCESHLRLGMASFTVILEEEYWDATSAASVVYNYVTGSQTCDPGNATCLEMFDQEVVFAGQKSEGLLPTDNTGKVDATKVVFLDGPAPAYMKLFFPFPAEALITARARPWYNIEMDEMIMVEVVGDAVSSGIRPLDPNPLSFTVSASRLHVPMIQLTETDIREATAPIVFNITLDCEEWKAGSEGFIPRAMYADPQPAPFQNLGWSGRGATITSATILTDAMGMQNVMQVSIAPDATFDLCTMEEWVAIDFGISLRHFKESEVEAIFASGETPTPYYEGMLMTPQKYKSALDSTMLLNTPYLAFKIMNTPSVATLTLFKAEDPHTACAHPCVFTEAEIRRGGAGMNVTLSGYGATWSDPPMLTLGLNSSLFSQANSFMGRSCTLAPRSGVVPQTVGGGAVTTATLNFFPDADFDIIIDELVTLTIPSGNAPMYDVCQGTQIQPTPACWVLPSGTFSFRIDGKPGQALSCTCMDCDVPSGTPSNPPRPLRVGRALPINITGTELDSYAGGDVAFAVPVSLRCSDGLNESYAGVTDLGDADARGLESVVWNPIFHAAGVYRTCYKSKGTSVAYDVSLCSPLTIVGDVHNASTSDGTLGPFRLGQSYDLMFMGMGLSTFSDRAKVVRAEDPMGCDSLDASIAITASGTLKPDGNSNVGPFPMSGRNDPELASRTMTTWMNVSFEGAGRFRMCYMPTRAMMYTDLGEFVVYGVVTDFTPRIVNASQATELHVMGLGLRPNDTVFFSMVTDTPIAFDPMLDCVAKYPGDGLAGVEVRAMNATADGMKSMLHVPAGVLYKPGKYHICYRYDNTTQWDVVPATLLHVLPSITSFAPHEGYVNPAPPHPDAATPTVFDLVSWSTTEIWGKLVRYGESCAGDRLSGRATLERVDGGLIPGPNVSTTPEYNGFQKTIRINAIFTGVEAGTYYWCYTSREMLECATPTTPWDDCTANPEVSATRWYMLPKPVVISPRFGSFSPELMRSATLTTITAPALSPVDLGVLGTTVHAKLWWGPATSCAQSDPRDEATMTVVKESGVQRTVTFDLTLEKAGHYILCLGTHRLGINQTLHVYPYVTGMMDVSMEARALAVTPTAQLPQSAKPLPITVMGFGLHGAGLDQLGMNRTGSEFGAVPWGVADANNAGMNLTCANYSAFAGGMWWSGENPDVMRLGPTPVDTILEGAVDRARRVVFSTTYTPGWHILCFYDWVRMMWMNVTDDVAGFYVPPNTPPIMALSSKEATVHPDSGAVVVEAFFSTFAPGTYAAENNQTVTVTLTPVDGVVDAAPFVAGGMPMFDAALNALRFELAAGAPPGSYRFAVIARDDGGVKYGGMDTAMGDFMVNVRGITGVMITPRVINVRGFTNATFMGAGLTGGAGGDCVRIISADDPMNCERMPDLPDEYKPICPVSVPNCHTPEDLVRIDALAAAWRYGNAYGPWSVPEVIPDEIRLDPTFPDPLDIFQNQLIDAWREGKRAASVHDICTLTPESGFANLMSTTLMTPPIDKPGNYSLCYRLASDVGANGGVDGQTVWRPVAGSGFVVDPLVTGFVPHALLAAVPGELNISGYGLASIDEVVGVYMGDAGANVTGYTSCADYAAAGLFNTVNVGGSGAAQFRGFVYSPQVPGGVSTGLTIATLRVGDDMIRQSGMYKLCYRASATARWTDVAGGYLRVFASVHTHDALEQVYPGQQFKVNFTAVAVTPPDVNGNPTNTTVLMKVVRADCGGLFPNCRVDCTNPDYLYFPEKVMTDVYALPHPSGDGLSRGMTELVAFDAPGYYYPCWTTAEIRNCMPVGNANPKTCVYAEKDHPWVLMEDAIVVTPLYQGFTPFVGEAGVELAIDIHDVDGREVDFFDLGRPGVVLRTDPMRTTGCRDMAISQDHITDTTFRSIHYRDREGFSTFRVNLTRSGDYDVCVGMTRVGDYTTPATPAPAPDGLFPIPAPRRDVNCPYWTEVGAKYSPVICDNTTTFLRNRHVRIQPRVEMWEAYPMAKRFYGAPLTLRFRGWGLETGDSVYVINGTDGSSCTGWDGVPSWAKFGQNKLTAPMLSLPRAGWWVNDPEHPPVAGSMNMLADGTPQPWGIVEAEWNFAFPRPGDYRLCYHSSLFSWSRVIDPLFNVPLPTITEWDWVIASENPPRVELRFYGSSLNAMPNNGDRIMIVRNDQIDSDGPPCQRDVFHFAVAERSEDLGPTDAMGLNMTNFIWYDRDLNNFDFVRDYTICYAHCWLSDRATECLPYQPVGEIQTPIRNMPPELSLAKDVVYTRPCSDVSIFTTPPTPGRPQEMWDSRSKEHLQNLTYTVTYSKVLGSDNASTAACSICDFAEPLITDGGLLRQSFRGLGTYRMRVTAMDDGGTALGGIDTATTPEFTLVLTGQNTAPFFTAVPRVAVKAAAAGSATGGTVGGCRSVQIAPDTFVRECETTPVVVGEVSAGSLEWESEQELYWDVSPVSGDLAPYFAAKPTYNPVTRNLTVTLAPMDNPEPVEVDVHLTAYDDPVLGPSAPYPPNYCGESRTRKRITIAIEPVNYPPRFNWQGTTTLMVYELRQYIINNGRPTPGPVYEEVTQELLEPTVEVVGGGEGKFDQQPMFLKDGTLSFQVSAGLITFPPETIRVVITLRDNGGTDEGGVDTATLELNLVVSSYYALEVTPATLPQGSGPVTMTVTGGVPNMGSKVFYVWLNSGGSSDLGQFARQRDARSGVVVVAGPQTGDAAQYASLPTGTHSVFTLVFGGGEVDYHALERSGARMCPGASTQGNLDAAALAPCYLAKAVTVAPAGVPLTDTVQAAGLAARNDAVPAGTALAMLGAAAEQLAQSGSAASAPAVRDTIAGDIAAASQRLQAAPGSSTADHVGNGLAAVGALIGSATPDEVGSVPLSDAATQQVAEALGALGDANVAVWERCCSEAALPAGCTSHDMCALSCCGTAHSTAEVNKVAGAVLDALDRVAASSTASAAPPQPWDSESAREAGQSPQSLARRRQAAAAMATFVNSLNEVGRSMCVLLHDQGMMANRTSAGGYADPAPYVKSTTEFATHVTAMHKAAVVRAADTAVVPHGGGEVTVQLTRDVTTRNGAFHGCRIVHTFHKDTPFEGDGNPDTTPKLPVVSMLLAPIDRTVAVDVQGRTAFRITIPTGEPGLSLEDVAEVTWNPLAVAWVRTGVTNVVVTDTTAEIVGSSDDIYGAKTPQRRAAAPLQQNQFPTSEIRGLVVNPGLSTICFACTAVPVYWGCFILFFLLALCVQSSDRTHYGRGGIPECTDRRTPCCRQVLLHHMWTAPLLMYPVSLGYYSRSARVVTVFTFFIVALAMPAPFFDNEGVRYAWEAEVDWGKAAWVGCLGGLIAELCAVLVLFIFFPGARTGARRLLKHGANGQKVANGVEASPAKSVVPGSPESPVNVYIDENEVLLPAMPAMGRIVAGSILFLLLAAGGSVMVFLLTDEYTVGTQGEQYMAAFMFACLFHVLYEALRSMVAIASGAYHGQGYYGGRDAAPSGHHADISQPLTDEMEMKQTPSPGREPAGLEEIPQPTFDPSPPRTHDITPSRGYSETPAGANTPPQPPMPVRTGTLGRGAANRARPPTDFGVVRSKNWKDGYEPAGGSGVGVGGSGVFRTHTQAMLNAGGGYAGGGTRSVSEGGLGNGHASPYDYEGSLGGTPPAYAGRGYATYDPDAPMSHGQGFGRGSAPRSFGDVPRPRGASTPPPYVSASGGTGAVLPFESGSPGGVGRVAPAPPPAFPVRGRGDGRQNTFTQFASQPLS